MSEILIGEGDIPPDTVPPTTDSQTSWFNADFPHSTQDAPYGFFPLADGTPDFMRPRKRRPRGYGGSTSSASTARMPSSEKSAETAASILAR